MSKVLKMRRPSIARRLECQACGATADASCDCGAPYVPAGQRAVAAIKANPRRSDRAIAAEIGVDRETVARARKTATGGMPPVEKRTGKDGKVRRLPTRQQPGDSLLLPEFEKIVAQLEKLCAKSEGLFAGTARAPSDLENLAEKFNAWLRGIAKAKQAAARQKHAA